MVAPPSDNASGEHGSDISELPVEVRTLADLARIAGVSAGTVSRALAGKSLVNAETRDRIQALARHYGFRPNQMASKLRSRRTGVIGVVIPLGSARRRDISNPFFLALLGHLAEELTQRGYDLMLSCALPDGTADWLERMTGSGMVDGVLVIGQSDQFDVIERVARSYQPLVVWGQYRAGQAHLAVASDNELGGRIAAEHLIACGARKIAFLGETTSIEVAMRHVGASAAAKAAGLELRHLPVSLADEEMQGQLASFFGTGNPPDIDGIVAASDLIALRAMQVLHRLGRIVPDDIQIVGFDDLPVASLSEPALTTIRQEIGEGAVQMVAKLMSRIAREDVGSSVTTPRLVIRGTTRPS